MKSTILFLATFLFLNIISFSQSTIIIKSEPIVSVFLDNDFKGITNSKLDSFIIKDVSFGEHIIKVSKDGYLPVEQKINIINDEFNYIVEPFTNKVTDEITIVKQDIIEIYDIEEEVEDSPIFTIVEEMPIFMPHKCKSKEKGDGELQKYIAKHVVYPKEALRDSIQGKVYVEFVVNTIGKVTNAKIVRGIAPILDKEALVVIRSLPDFSHGLQRGKSVRVKYTVPIVFCVKASLSTLNIICEPDVLVALDHKARGRTNSEIGGLIIENISFGEHILTLNKDSFIPVSVKINVASKELKYIAEPFNMRIPNEVIEITNSIMDTINIEKFKESMDYGDAVFTIVEEMPIFMPSKCKTVKESRLEMNKYIAKYTKYPRLAREDGIQGKVYVDFIVNKKGKVTNVKIVRGIHPLLNKEAIRLINSLPDFLPGKQRGKPVRVKYTLPVIFRLG